MLYYFLRDMKDIIKRIIISLISWWFLWYLWYLFFQQTIIVESSFVWYNTLYYGILWLIFIFLFILFGVYPIHFRMTKASLFVVWLALIIVWDTVLINDVTRYIYIWDIIKVFGVILTLLAWTNVLITNKVKKQQENKKVEIIEV